MKFSRVITVLFLFPVLLSAQQQSLPWETYYEKSGFLETPRYDKTVRYCKQLAEASPMLHYTNFGLSTQNRELPLLIVDKDGYFTPQQIHESGKLILLVQACVHPGESDGKDAGLMLVRDMVIHGKHKELLDKLSLLFIPVLNVDGHERFSPYNRINQNGPKEMGWRTNAQNLNLNRDYLKAESAEIINWLQLFQEWMPDFLIDCHATDGADYQYPLTYGMEIYGSMDEGITSWQKDAYLKDVSKLMAGAGMPICPYVDFRNWHDPRSGLETWASPPMFSQGYCAVQNRPNVLIETHMLKDYKTRVSATYEMIRFSMQILNRDAAKVKKLIRDADESVTKPEFRTAGYALSYETSPKDSVMVEFLGVDYTVEKSDLSGGDWFKYSDKPRTYAIPFFNKLIPKAVSDLPEAYLIPPEWKEVINKLRLHGIQTKTLPKETRMMAEVCRLTNPKFRPTPYEGRQTVETGIEIFTEERVFQAGTVIVPMDQRLAKVIAHLLEPQAPSSLLWWGYFNTVFEQKEYSESYVMEKMAREMMQKDPELLKRFTEKRDADPEFTKTPFDVLNWFYKQTPYWDKQKDVYPVVRIQDPALLKSLLK